MIELFILLNAIFSLIIFILILKIHSMIKKLDGGEDK